jgi:hypothetical protein
MSELSREAMALLELSPRWTLRPEFRAVPAANGLMMIAVAISPEAKSLWHKVAAAMVSIGFPRGLIEDAILIEGGALDVAVSAVATRKPSSILCFGETLAGQIHSAHQSLLSERAITTLASLDDVVKNPSLKSALWSMLCGLRSHHGFTR